MKKIIHKIINISFCFIVLPLLFSCTPITKNSCFNKGIDPDKVEPLMHAASALEGWLNSTEYTVVVLARTGQDLTKYDIEFSHAAFAKRDESGWTVYHLLNDCPSNTGKLYQEGLANFLSSAKKERIAVVAPQLAIQQTLSKLLESKAERNSVFDAHYNAAAYPFAIRDQNSNGWILEFFSKTVAMKSITSREEAVQWLSDDNYQPSALQVGKIKQFFIELFVPNASRKGQPRERRRDGNLLINGGDAVLNYIARYGLTLSECPVSNLTQYSNINEKVCLLPIGLDEQVTVDQKPHFIQQRAL